MMEIISMISERDLPFMTQEGFMEMMDRLENAKFLNKLQIAIISAVIADKMGECMAVAEEEGMLDRVEGPVGSDE
jgi:hypothetical protein